MNDTDRTSMEVRALRPDWWFEEIGCEVPTVLERGAAKLWKIESLLRKIADSGYYGNPPYFLGMEHEMNEIVLRVIAGTTNGRSKDAKQVLRQKDR